MCANDLRGKRYGRLTCLEATDRRGQNGSVLWRCRCDCGNECLASVSQLNRGGKKSCGCLGGLQRQDLTGRRFGSLVVTGYDGYRGRKHYWRCRCDCGKETVVNQSNLATGHTKSCGCLQRETYRDNLRLVDGTSVTMIERRMCTAIKSNTSGYNGVYKDKSTGLWCAQITFKGKTHYLGSFRDIQDAVKARRRSEEMYDEFLESYYGRTAARSG